MMERTESIENSVTCVCGEVSISGARFCHECGNPIIPALSNRSSLESISIAVDYHRHHSTNDKKSKTKQGKQKRSKAERTRGIPEASSVRSFKQLPSWEQTASREAPEFPSLADLSAFQPSRTLSELLYEVDAKASEWELTKGQKEIIDETRNNIKLRRRRKGRPKQRRRQTPSDSGSLNTGGVAGDIDSMALTQQLDVKVHSSDELPPRRLSELRFTASKVEAEVEQQLKDLEEEVERVSREGSCNSREKIEDFEVAEGMKAKKKKKRRKAKNQFVKSESSLSHSNFTRTRPRDPATEKREQIKLWYSQRSRGKLRKSNHGPFSLSKDQLQALQQGGIRRGRAVFVPRLGDLEPTARATAHKTHTPAEESKPKTRPAIRRPSSTIPWGNDPVELWKGVVTINGIDLEVSFFIKPLPKISMLLRKFNSVFVIRCYRLGECGSHDRMVFEEEISNEEMGAYTLGNRAAKEWIDPFRTKRGCPEMEKTWHNLMYGLIHRVTSTQPTRHYLVTFGLVGGPVPTSERYYSCHGTEGVKVCFDRTAFRTGVLVPFGPPRKLWRHPMVVRIRLIPTIHPLSGKKQIELGLYCMSVWTRPWARRCKPLYLRIGDHCLPGGLGGESASLMDLIGIHGVGWVCSHVVDLLRLEYSRRKGVILTYLGEHLDLEMHPWPEEMEETSAKNQAATIIQRRARGILARKRCNWIRMEKVARQKLAALNKEREQARLRKEKKDKEARAQRLKEREEKSARDVQRVYRGATGRRLAEAKRNAKIQVEQEMLDMSKEDFNVLRFVLDSIDAVISEPEEEESIPKIDSEYESRSNPSESGDTIIQIPAIARTTTINKTETILIAQFLFEDSGLNVHLRVRDIISNQVSSLVLSPKDLQTICKDASSVDITHFPFTEYEKLFGIICSKLTLFFSRESNIMILSFHGKGLSSGSL